MGSSLLEDESTVRKTTKKAFFRMKPATRQDVMTPLRIVLRNREHDVQTFEIDADFCNYSVFAGSQALQSLSSN
jgi:hypothetical protein